MTTTVDGDSVAERMGREIAPSPVHIPNGFRNDTKRSIGGRASPICGPEGYLHLPSRKHPHRLASFLPGLQAGLHEALQGASLGRLSREMARWQGIGPGIPLETARECIAHVGQQKMRNLHSPLPRATGHVAGWFLHQKLRFSTVKRRSPKPGSNRVQTGEAVQRRHCDVHESCSSLLLSVESGLGL